MKKIQVLLLTFVLLSAGLVAQSSGSKFFKPINYSKKVTTLVSEKSRSYYSLDHEQASVVILRGPGVLRVMTRSRFVSGEKSKSLDYKINYAIDGGEWQSVELNGEKSGNAHYKNTALGIPGDMVDFEIELDRGDHTIEFLLNDNKIAVAARYKLIPKKAKKLDWIAYCPLQPSEPVDLISRESSVSYYRFSMDKPIKIEVNGPTQVRVLTRIENHYHMKGRILYRLQVTENNEVINTYQLSSVRSEIAVYKDHKDLIPGKAREFVIQVPKGKHTYEIQPLDKDKSTVLGRFLLPRKDVKLGN